MPLLYCLIAGLQAYGQSCAYETIAGASRTFYGEGVPASEALVNGPRATLAAPDGSIYVSDTYNHRVRRIDSAGLIHTVAGTGEPTFGGDGGPATKAALFMPYGLAMGSDGSLYIADSGNNRVRKVAKDGTISTVAGDGFAGLAGDGGSGTKAILNNPTFVALDSKDNLYILDSGNLRVRKIGTDGVITTFAGSYIPGGSQDGDSTATEQPATKARLGSPQSIAVDKNSILYIAEQEWVRQVDTNGVMTALTSAAAKLDNDYVCRAGG